MKLGWMILGYLLIIQETLPPSGLRPTANFMKLGLMILEYYAAVWSPTNGKFYETGVDDFYAAVWSPTNGNSNSLYRLI